MKLRITTDFLLKQAVVALAMWPLANANNASAQIPLDQGAKAAARYTSLKQDDKQLEGDIRRFLGNTRNINSKDEGPVSDQVIEHIALPSEPFTTRLRDGGWLISGSLPGAAETKGAVIVDRSGRIKAAALLEYAGERDLIPRYESWIYVKDQKADASYIAEIDRHFGNASKIPHKIYVLTPKAK